MGSKDKGDSGGSGSIMDLKNNLKIINVEISVEMIQKCTRKPVLEKKRRREQRECVPWLPLATCCYLEPEKKQKPSDHQLCQISIITVIFLQIDKRLVLRLIL